MMVLRQLILTSTLLLIAACGGGGGDDSRGPIEETADLAGTWATPVDMSSAQSNGSGEFAFLIDASGFVYITQTTEEFVMELPIRFTYLGDLALDEGTVAGELGYLSSGPPREGSATLFATLVDNNTMAGTVTLDSDTNYDFYVEYSAPQEPVSDYSLFARAWQGFDQLYLEFDEAGSGFGSYQRDCVADAQLMPFYRDNWQRISLALTGCDQAATYIGTASVSTRIINNIERTSLTLLLTDYAGLMVLGAEPVID